MWLKKVHIYKLVWFVVYFSMLPIVGFLELINNMLTSGMVPALFADDEKDQIIGQVIKTTMSVTVYPYIHTSMHQSLYSVCQLADVCQM